jgi:hypothetical protein
MDNTKTQKNTEVIRSWKKTVGRPRMRWEDIRRDSLLLLNVWQWWRLTGNKDTWRRILKRSRPDTSCRGGARGEEDEEDGGEEKGGGGGGEEEEISNFKMPTAR